MNINYYNSVTVRRSKHREQAFSLTSTLYNWGDTLSKASSLYKGKSYTLCLSKDDVFKIGAENKIAKYSCWQKMGAVVGRCLKAIAGYFDSKIQAKHLLAQELEKETPDQAEIKKYRSIVLNTDNSKKSEISNGEGAGTGLEIGAAACCCLFIGIIALVWGLVAKGGVAH